MCHREAVILNMKIIPTQLFYFADSKAGIAHKGERELFFTLTGGDEYINLLGGKAWLGSGLSSKQYRMFEIPILKTKSQRQPEFKQCCSIRVV